MIKHVSKDVNGLRNKIKWICNSCLALILTGSILLLTCEGAQDNTTDYWMNQARDLGHKGMHEEALQAYDEVLKLDPKNVTALLRKASDLGSMGRENESLSVYEKALAISEETLKTNPMEAFAWQDKAIALSGLGRQKEV